MKFFVLTMFFVSFSLFASEKDVLISCENLSEWNHPFSFLRIEVKSVQGQIFLNTILSQERFSKGITLTETPVQTQSTDIFNDLFYSFHIFQLPNSNAFYVLFQSFIPFPSNVTQTWRLVRMGDNDITEDKMNRIPENPDFDDKENFLEASEITPQFLDCQAYY